MKIDIYSDIACPWCFIGARRLESVIAAYGDGVEFVLRHRPYMLHPDAPPDGIDAAAMLKRKYGADILSMFGRVESAARDAGIELDLSRQTRAYSTVGAHTLLRHAAGKGTQRSLVDGFFTAYFIDARNISAAAVLTDVASRHGFTAAEVERILHDEHELALTRREVAEASRAGITGVPFFVLDDRYSLSGARPAETFRRAIALALEADTEHASTSSS